MSKRVIFTCTLLLLLGVVGMLDTFSSFSRGPGVFNLLVLFVPVAIALFMGLPGARIAATLVFSLIYLMLALLLAGASLARVHILRPDFPLLDLFPAVVVLVAMFGSVLALLHWMLYSPPFDEHLNH